MTLLVSFLTNEVLLHLWIKKYQYLYRKLLEQKRKEIEEKEKYLNECDIKLKKRKDKLDQLEKTIAQVSKDWNLVVFIIYLWNIL